MRIRLLTAVTVVVILSDNVAIPAAAARTQQSESSAAPIVRTERAGPGVVRVVYDLPGPHGATFNVVLEASDDGGRTFTVRPRALTGDVGEHVSPGAEKAIFWDSAKDVDDLQVDRYVFRVLVSRGQATRQTASAVGTLHIVTQPPGASVIIDGRARGTSPLTTSNLSAGSHQVTLTKTGYLENRSTIEIVRDETTELTRTLTTAKGGENADGAKSNGGLSRGLIAAIAGGGAAAGVGIALANGRGGSSTPAPAGTPSGSSLAITTLPVGAGIRDVTMFTFAASGGGPSSPTYTWEFGDGGTASGPTVTHVYAAEGAFSVTLRASAGNDRATSTATVTVGSVTGTWRTAEDGGGITWSLILVQQGSVPTGTWRMDYGPTCAPTTCPLGPNSTELWPMSATLADPRQIIVNQLAQCRRTFTAVIAPDLRSISGTFVNGVASCGLGQSSVTYVRQ